MSEGVGVWGRATERQERQVKSSAGDQNQVNDLTSQSEKLSSLGRSLLATYQTWIQQRFYGNIIGFPKRHIKTKQNKNVLR